MLKFIRHQIAAIGIGTYAQGILHINEIFMPDAVPEGLLVSVGCTAFLLTFRIRFARLFYNRCRSRLSHHGIHTLLAFQAVDFLAQIHHIRFHLVVTGGVFGGHHAVFITHVSRKVLADSQRFFLFSRSAKIVSIMFSSYQ